MRPRPRDGRLAATSEPALDEDAGTRVRPPRETIALLRLGAARHPDDLELRRLSAELRAQSDDAADWWNTHDVAQKRHGLKRYIHPNVGELTLHCEALLLPDDGYQLPTIYAAATGVRAWLATRPYSWVTPRPLRVATARCSPWPA